MRWYIIFLLILSVILPNGCIKETPLSIIEVEDPSIIRPEIHFSYSIEDGNVSQNVFAWIYDRYSHSIQIKDGAVLLNGAEMMVKRKDDLPFYSGIETISDILPGHRYDLVIMLSPQKAFDASITIQPKLLISLNIPPKHSRNDEMEISWTEIDSSRALQLEIITTAVSNGEDLTSRVVVPVPLGSLASGRYTIPAGFFKSKPGIYKAVILLRNIKTGTIYGGFANGSKIISDISVARTCEIN